MKTGAHEKFLEMLGWEGEDSAVSCLTGRRRL